MDSYDDAPVTDDLVIDLLDDPREVAGVLGFGYPVVPAARPAAEDLALAAARLDGYGEYGS
ncbi:MAG: hypothetical protein JWN17_1846 [Frankiales bacterium]|nr:hypothetical protein [Frankiales bacterium]